jgi:hypothetical protein
MFQVLPSMAGQQVSCPHCQGVIVVPGFGGSPSGMPPPSPPPQGPPGAGGAGPPSPSSTSASSRPKVVAKPAEGPVKPAEQRTKTVGRGREKIELRRLTPAELAARRRTRNLIMGTVFILLLGAIFVVLLNME